MKAELVAEVAVPGNEEREQIVPGEPAVVEHEAVERDDQRDKDQAADREQLGLPTVTAGNRWGRLRRQGNPF